MRKLRWNYQPLMNVLMTLAIVFVFVPVYFPVFARGSEVVPMSLDFTNTDNQYVQFTRSYAHAANMTFCSWFVLDSLTNDGGLFWEFDNPYTGKYFLLSYGGTANSSKLYFAAGFSTTAGVWSVSSAESGITTGTPFLMCVTYGNTGTPVVYINGVSKAVVEENAPVGTAPSWTGGITRIGAQSGVTANVSSINGRILDTRVYSFIATAADIANIYNSRSFNVHPAAGLPVFQPILYGAAALQNFAVVLAAGNTITDPYSGARGVPAGSPLGVAETYLTVNP